MDDFLIIVFVIGSFLFSFVIAFVVLKVMAKFGWGKLAAIYGYDREFEGEKMGMVSMVVNTAQYSNAISLYLGAEGIYLKPFFLFRASHKPLMIPAKQIAEMPGGLEEIIRTGVIVISEKPRAVVNLSPKIIYKLKQATGK
ncbi:MAG: hypothetical protein JXR58_02225 [Bacteroidales bacterium]|nr:hypothetical protein [Bacteroidales bacterium]